MAEICCGAVGESKASTLAEEEEEGSSRAARRRRMEIRRFKFIGGIAPAKDDTGNTKTTKRQKTEEVDSSEVEEKQKKRVFSARENGVINITHPKYGVASVCGRRRDMEDAVVICPSFFGDELHYVGVYDGHGCSHVAARCRERLHELVREEAEEALAPATTDEWKRAMEKSFCRMDKEVIAWNEAVVGATHCRCEMQTPECDAVGSTAVVAVITPDKIIVANCGDSRAVLSRNGKPIPLSSDHKPDRPDELNRIQAAGGRVIYWDGPRVLGVLAMSRAIGDNYLKPYVSCEPEVTVTERTAEDDCLILASDGLWDVVSNDTACGVARMCLKGKGRVEGCASTPENVVAVGESGGATTSCGGGEMSDKACSDASTLLTKLALARHSTDNVSVVVVDLRRDT